MLRTRLGGTLDTAALTALGGSALLSSPFFAGEPTVASLALATAGSAWLSEQYLSFWRDRNALHSKLAIRSDKSPMDPKKGEGGLLLGYSTFDGSPIWIDYENLMRHVFIIGQSGVGKTVAASLLMYQHIQNGGGLLFIDGKIDADNIRQIAHFCALAGREKEFRVINPDDPDQSNTYNPVYDGDPDEQASRLLSLIPSTEGNPGADHYKQEAAQGVTTLIMALRRAGLVYHIMDLSVLLQSAQALEELKTKVEAAAPGSEEAINYALFLEKFRSPANDPRNPNAGSVDVKKLKDTFGGIGGRLFQFGTGNYGRIMKTYDPEVRLYDAIRKNQIVYVALPTMGKDISAENFGKIVISDLRTAVSWLQKLPKEDRPWPPYMCFCDEAGAYVGKTWPRLFEQARSAQIFMMPAVQTFANFKAVSDDLAEMVKGNSWTKVYFKIGTQASAEEAADEIGMETGVAQTLSGGKNESSSANIANPAPVGSAGDGTNLTASEKEEECYRVSPDELKKLDKGEAVMTYGGDLLYNIRIPKLDITKTMQKRLGTVRINHKRPAYGIKGADFFANVPRYLDLSAARPTPKKEKRPKDSDTD